MPHPETAPRLVTAILPWSGTLPVPRLARFLVRNLWWNLLSRRRILQALVRNVYADKYVPHAPLHSLEVCCSNLDSHQ